MCGEGETDGPCVVCVERGRLRGCWVLYGVCGEGETDGPCVVCVERGRLMGPVWCVWRVGD